MHQSKLAQCREKDANDILMKFGTEYLEQAVYSAKQQCKCFKCQKLAIFEECIINSRYNKNCSFDKPICEECYEKNIREVLASG